MLMRILNKYINELGWSKLRALGHNSIIKSSYIWLIIVPLAAKIFSALPEVHIFIIFGANITIHFGLPFSWIIFYFMAIFFAIGQLIYSLKCPEILKNYTNFSDYEKSGSNDLFLLKLLENICYYGNRNDLSIFETYMTYFIKEKQETNEKQIKIHNECRIVKEYISYSFSISDKEQTYKDFLYEHCILSFKKRGNPSDWFYVISNSYEQVNQNYLKASATCFGLGFFFFTIIAIQNLWFVIKAIF